MVKTCGEKCIPGRFGEEELNKGELVCVDRCVAKFFKANLIIGQYLKNMQVSPDSFGPVGNLPTGV
jgi:mitochondrial import inner membrane translocase subunit TIM12